MAFVNWIWVSLLLYVCCSLPICSADIGRKELRPKEVNQEVSMQLNKPIHYNKIDPSRVTQLSWRPRVFLYKGFLSDEECDHLISLARGKEETLSKNDGDSGTTGTSKKFTSSETLLSLDDKISASIEERTSAWTFLPKEHSKPLQVMHYGLEEAKLDYDFFGNKSILGLAEPLLATVVLYLSNVTQGGGIVFPKSEVKSKNKIWSDCTKSDYTLRPIKGNAVLFFHLHPSASPDNNSGHNRCPVQEGEMWAATKYFHVRAIRSDMNLVESDGDECTDEDDNCARWAAIGECKRNPVFMIGSPDYYGTCRKSCSSC